MENFTIKRNDRIPFIQSTLTDADNAPIPLTGCSVFFVMRKPQPRCATSAPIVIRRAAVIVDAEAGVVRYEWQPGDTAVAGTYLAEWEVQDSTGRPFTVPSVDCIPVTVILDQG